MARNRLLKILSGTVVFIMACTFGGLLNPTPTPPLPTAQPTQPSTTQGGDMAGALERLGGIACDENPDFICVTVQVPLDHFDSSNTETLGMVFAVAPATGERLGMYVQAFPGGPGGEGISTGGLNWYDDAILEHFDIVYFDQRGVGLSGPLACPTAYAQDFLSYLNE
ncbi:MAG TPA: hypothetical protein VMJ90_09855, partial [Anaerolineales bacterium]|nr:hypothetical protein [Anaerolineales bacterium]